MEQVVENSDHIQTANLFKALIILDSIYAITIWNSNAGWLAPIMNAIKPGKILIRSYLGDFPGMKKNMAAKKKEIL